MRRMGVVIKRIFYSHNYIHAYRYKTIHFLRSGVLKHFLKFKLHITFIVLNFEITYTYIHIVHRLSMQIMSIGIVL